MAASSFHPIFNDNEVAEKAFRKGKKQHFASTELAYTLRFLNKERDLRSEISESSISIISCLKTLSNGTI